MRKRIYLTALAMLLSINILGCGKIEDNSDKSSVGSSSIQNTPDENNTNNSDTSADNDSTSNIDATASPESTIPEETPSDNSEANDNSNPTPTPKVKIAKVSMKQQYSDINKVVKILGLKEYKKVESDKYTDVASKGKKYLVLFLSIRNDSVEDYYVNYNYLSAKVDGKDIENTYLVNEPKNYTTIFDHIEAGKSKAGFIVWEVPEDWSKLELTYDGWMDIDNTSIKAKFTPKDLSNPILYNANDYL